MPRITYVEHNGTAHEVEVADGQSLMEGAIQNDVPGIDGDCGGNAACATCHIFIRPDWRAKLPAPGDMELAMVEMASGFDPESSRLACQIRVSPLLDGLVVDMPESQQ
jgi:2Fe-2S ferredoxin